MNQLSGNIQLIVGPMFGGKSSELLRLARRYSIQNKRVLLVKHSSDTRYNCNAITTHNQECVQSMQINQINEIQNIITNYDVICIDEGQFFDDIHLVDSFASVCNKIVIIAALDAKFNREPFYNIVNLIPKCEYVTKLNAICKRCFQLASFSNKIPNADGVIDQQQIVVGGSDKYESLCRHCFNQANSI